MESAGIVNFVNLMFWFFFSLSLSLFFFLSTVLYSGLLVAFCGTISLENLRNVKLSL